MSSPRYCKIELPALPLGAPCFRDDLETERVGIEGPAPRVVAADHGNVVESFDHVVPQVRRSVGMGHWTGSGTASQAL